MDSEKVIIGILAGAAAGALLGVLFAPAKGSKTRKRILKKGEALTQELKEVFDEFLDTITEKYESIKEEVDDFAERNQLLDEEETNNQEAV